MKRIILAIAMALAFSPASHGATLHSEGLDDGQRALYNSLQEKFRCQCGCGASVKLCPHIECGFAIPFRKVIKNQILSGFDEPAIIDAAVREHGEIILAAPTKTGFNLFGWVMPFLAIGGVGAAVFVAVNKWSGKGPKPPSTPKGGNGADDKYMDQLEKELDDYED